MAFVAWLLGLCLLAGAPARVDHDAVPRPHDEVTTPHALAKLAVRRHEGARPPGASVTLDAFVVTAVPAPSAPRRTGVESVHRSPVARRLALSRSFDARGPPHAEES